MCLFRLTYMLALVAGLAGCTTNTGNGSVSSTPTTEPSAESWTPPALFSKYSETIGWRWIEGGERKCPNDSRCIQMEVVTKDGCPTLLYAKASIVDTNNRNVGYTNSTTSGLRPGQRAVLTMPDTTSGDFAISATLDEISCS